MRILHRYIAAEFFRIAGIVLAAVVGIYVAVDFFERIDNFLEAGLGIDRTLAYLAYKIPFIVAQVAPVCLLLAMIVGFGLMTRHNEMIALRSGGVSLRSLVVPAAAIGLLMTAGLFLFSEIVVPMSAEKANIIWFREVKKRSGVVSREKNVWIKDNRAITHIHHYDKKYRDPHTGVATPTVFGITLFQFDDDFHLSYRLDAREGVFQNGAWLLSGLMEQILDPTTGQYEVSFDGQRREELPVTPENLETIVKKSEEMGFLELLAYIRKVEAEGYDTTTYKVDLNAKIAFPFVCLILSLTGLAIGASRYAKEGLPAGVATGIGLAFLYWIFHGFCLSLGYGGVLPPSVAAWTANLVFFCFGILALLHVDT